MRAILSWDSKWGEMFANGVAYGHKNAARRIRECLADISNRECLNMAFAELEEVLAQLENSE